MATTARQRAIAEQGQALQGLFDAGAEPGLTIVELPGPEPAFTTRREPAALAIEIGGPAGAISTRGGRHQVRADWPRGVDGVADGFHELVPEVELVAGEHGSRRKRQLVFGIDGEFARGFE